MKNYLLPPSIFLFLIFSQTIFAQDAVTLFNDGVQLKKDARTKEALEKFKMAIALKPDYTEAIYESGWCQNELKDYEAAIVNLRKVRPVWSDVPKVFFELGYAFEKTNWTDSAIKSYRRCLELKPDYSSVYKQLGYISYTNEDYPTALEQFSKYELYVKTDIKDYLYWYRKGYTLNTQNDFSGAVTSLKESLKYKTDYTNTYLELGFASKKLKLDEDAIANYKKAMELDPKSYIPYNGIGEVYRDNKKDMVMAMSWYQKSLDIKPGERKALFGMGYCLNTQGKYNEAIIHLKKAIEAEATYTAAYVELGYSHYMIGKDSEAIDYCDKAIALNPKNENARYYKGLVYVSQKNKVMAQKAVDDLNALSSKLAATLKTKVDAL